MSKSTNTTPAIGHMHRITDPVHAHFGFIGALTSTSRGWATLTGLDDSTVKCRVVAMEPAKPAETGSISISRTCSCGARVTSHPIEEDDSVAEFTCMECGDEWQESVDFDDDDDDEGSQSKLARTIAKYRHKYVPTLAASGKKSLSNGDELAMLLAGLEATQVCDLADELLGFPLGYHFAKYCHLNKGSQRMNAGNKIRAALKRGDLAFDDKGNLTIVQHAGDDK